MRNRIGGKGAQYLIQALQHNQTIKSLELENNQIDVDGILLIADALRNNTV
ncbi:unnamed protein product, partial [Rotaria magnacalcarata]